MVSNGKGDMAQAQGLVVRGTAVFAGAQQEEEGDPDHLHGSGELGPVAWWMIWIGRGLT